MEASRARALRLSPPRAVATRKEGACACAFAFAAAVAAASASLAARITALPLSSPMLIPEWPPRRPRTERRRRVPAATSASEMDSAFVAGRTTCVSPPPAQPMNLRVESRERKRGGRERESEFFLFLSEF